MKEKHQVWITLGGDKLTLDIPVSTPTSDLTTFQLYWNIILLTYGSKNLVFDIQHFYFNNLM